MNMNMNDVPHKLLIEEEEGETQQNQINLPGLRAETNKSDQTKTLAPSPTFRRKPEQNKSKEEKEMEVLNDNIMVFSVKIHDMEIENLKNETAPNLECSSYFLATQILEFLLVFVKLIYKITEYALRVVILTLVYPCKREKPPITDFLYFIVKSVILACFLGILFFPSLVVIITQTVCVTQLLSETSTDDIQFSSQTLMAILQFFMAVFFSFIAMKEISSCFDVMAYFYKMKVWPTCGNRCCYLYGLCFSFIISTPQIIQICVSFYTLYISISIIIVTTDATSLIQNFAGLSILLEFDDIVMAFLRYIRFHQVFTIMFNCLLSVSTFRGISDIREEILKSYRDLRSLAQRINLEKTINRSKIEQDAQLAEVENRLSLLASEIERIAKIIVTKDEKIKALEDTLVLSTNSEEKETLKTEIKSHKEQREQLKNDEKNLTLELFKQKKDLEISLGKLNVLIEKMKGENTKLEREDLDNRLQYLEEELGKKEIEIENDKQQGNADYAEMKTLIEKDATLTQFINFFRRLMNTDSMKIIFTSSDYEVPKEYRVEKGEKCFFSFAGFFTMIIGMFVMLAYFFV